MKNIKILAISLLLLSGCAFQSSMPEFPDIKKHYYILMDFSDKEHTIVKGVFCIEYDVISKFPYKIANGINVPLAKCNLVNGYQYTDFKTVSNWVVGVNKWAIPKQKCFK